MSDFAQAIQAALAALADRDAVVENFGATPAPPPLMAAHADDLAVEYGEDVP